MAHMNIEKLSLSCKDRFKEEEQKKIKKKHIIVLISQYLTENGFMFSADALKSEVNFCIDDFRVCDNIHLELILQDYESYYFLKYQKIPLLVKSFKKDSLKTHHMGGNKSFNNISTQKKYFSHISSQAYKDMLVPDGSKSSELPKEFSEILESHDYFKNLGCEWKPLAHLIMEDISKENKIMFSSIIGHENAKQLLKEAAIYPLKYSNLLKMPVLWKSMLLYGPSGTGKTLLANAIATESKSIFFKISTSTLVSKWRGDSEKLVKMLFELAIYYAPSIVFIDEIDSLLCHRGFEHEASKRMKTEFFLQMDRLMSSDKQVLVIGATNMPWELDNALLRRMEKRVFIKLPDYQDRVELFKKYLPSPITFSEKIHLKVIVDYETLSNFSEGYAASDVELVCKDTKMHSLRQIYTLLEINNKQSGNLESFLSDFQSLETADVLASMDRTRPSAKYVILKYEEWMKKFGSE